MVELGLAALIPMRVVAAVAACSLAARRVFSFKLS
jgi:hypothetical protein